MNRHPEFNSQQRLSRLTGVGQSTVGRIRRAENAATIDIVASLAKAFGLTASQLLDPRLPEFAGGGKNLDTAQKAAAIAAEIQESNLSDAQLTILANTLAAMRSK